MEHLYEKTRLKRKEKKESKRQKARRGYMYKSGEHRQNPNRLGQGQKDRWP